MSWFRVSNRNALIVVRSDYLAFLPPALLALLHSNLSSFPL